MKTLLAIIFLTVAIQAQTVNRSDDVVLPDGTRYTVTTLCPDASVSCSTFVDNTTPLHLTDYAS